MTRLVLAFGDRLEGGGEHFRGVGGEHQRQRNGAGNEGIDVEAALEAERDRHFTDRDLQAEIDHEDGQKFRQAAKDGGVDVGGSAKRADFGLLGECEKQADDQADGEGAERQGDCDEEAARDLVSPASVAAGQQRAFRQQVEHPDRTTERIEQRYERI